MRFEALSDRHERIELSRIEAAEMLGIGERTCRHWRDRLRDEGVENLRDRRIGKPSSRRAAAEAIGQLSASATQRSQRALGSRFRGNDEAVQVGAER